MSTIRVAAMQLRAHDRADFAAWWPALIPRITEVAHEARLVVLPEACAPAYLLGSEAYDGVATNRLVTDLCAIAHETKTTFVVGAARRDAQGRVFNSAFVLDIDGNVAGIADKFCLWHFDERWFTRGEHIAPIHSSLGSLGVLVCADGRIPALANQLVMQGAQMLIMPTAWVTSGRNERDLENLQADLLVQTRANENHIPFIAANKCGVEGAMVKYCGKSQILDSQGNRLALASQTDEETIFAEITFGAPRFNQAKVPPVEISSDCEPRSFRCALFIGDAVEIQQACTILDADAAIGTQIVPSDLDPRKFCRVGEINDAQALDPLGLTTPRLSGALLFVWRSNLDDTAHAMRIACSRAAELRCYVTLICANRRAWIIDPNGVVLCGVDHEYRVAVALLQPDIACRGDVAPHTNVLNELRRAVAVFTDVRA